MEVQNYVSLNFDGEQWTSNGPMAFTAVLFQMCGVEQVRHLVLNRCKDVTVLPWQSLYSTPWWEWRHIFEQYKQDVALDRVNTGTYAVHLWGKLSRDFDASMQKPSALHTLAAENCPASYNRSDFR